jgi:tetratricopeptide (TPR) repeat protein
MLETPAPGDLAATPLMDIHFWKGLSGYAEKGLTVGVTAFSAARLQQSLPSVGLQKLEPNQIFLQEVSGTASRGHGDGGSLRPLSLFANAGSILFAAVLAPNLSAGQYGGPAAGNVRADIDPESLLLERMTDTFRRVLSYVATGQAMKHTGDHLADIATPPPASAPAKRATPPPASAPPAAAAPAKRARTGDAPVPRHLTLKESGNAAFDDGEFGEAETYYLQALGVLATASIPEPQATGDKAALLSNLSAAALSRGDAAAALQHADRAVATSPGYPKAHHRRGKALNVLGRGGEAAVALAIAQALNRK